VPTDIEPKFVTADALTKGTNDEGLKRKRAQ
jgi:hypothetical protein